MRQAGSGSSPTPTPRVCGQAVLREDRNDVQDMPVRGYFQSKTPLISTTRSASRVVPTYSSSMPQPPKRLYKYRAFSALSIQSLVEDKVFLANPVTFNDPMDTRPVVTCDVGLDQLEALVGVLIQRRLTSEMERAAKTIRYGGLKTLAHIERLGNSRVQRTLADIAYNATAPDYENHAKAREWLLVSALQKELMLQYEGGILSLAARVNCPLMWSHYGDQHKGLCIGYAPVEGWTTNLRKVAYGGDRLIPVSAIEKMANGDADAKRLVDDAVLQRKARDWRYEREWRLVGPQGLQDSPFELKDVTFGFRCSREVKWAVVAALANRSKPVRFYEIREKHGTFLLRRERLDADELGMDYPRRARDGLDALDGFPDIQDLQPASNGKAA